MADTTKPVEVPETSTATSAPAAEATPAETTTAAPVAPESSPLVEETKTTEAPADTPAETPAAEAAAAPAEEIQKEAQKEVNPIEEGTLEHKGAPANFPKNLLYQKNHFWFGNDSVPQEKLSAYLKGEKVADTAHHVVSWAAHTGKGLLFFGKESDKTAPHGAIQLAEATEPTTEGANKFSVVSKGNKHTFKAPSAADRDNWVAQLKLKIAEAKELAATVTESETYKTTLESLKPKPAEKKDKEVLATDTPAVAAASETTAAEDTSAVEEAKKEEPKEEEKEEPKRRSASRKRASIFGGFLGKKDEKKKEEASAPVAEGSAEAETPATETTVPESTPAAEEAKATETTAAEETGTVPVTEEAKDTTPAKPIPAKRASLFGSLSFGKKKPEAEAAAPATPAKDATSPGAEPVSETAPVIPAVETSEPLGTLNSPATAPTENVEATATNGEKKEVKAKRTPSMPFGLGKKKDATATSDEEGEKEKVKSPPFFSKLRQTVKGGKKPAAAEKSSEDKPEAVVEAPAASEAAAETSTATGEAAPAAAEEPKPAAPAASTPVTAAA